MMHIIDEEGELIKIPEQTIMITGTSFPVDKSIFSKYLQMNSGIGADFVLEDKDKIFLLRQADNFPCKPANWPIIKAKNNDGFLEILVSNPKDSMDRLWIPLHPHLNTLDLVYTTMTIQDEHRDDDEEIMYKSKNIYTNTANSEYQSEKEKSQNNSECDNGLFISEQDIEREDNLYRNINEENTEEVATNIKNVGQNNYIYRREGEWN